MVNVSSLGAAVAMADLGKNRALEMRAQEQDIQKSLRLERQSPAAQNTNVNVSLKAIDPISSIGLEAINKLKAQENDVRQEQVLEDNIVIEMEFKAVGEIASQQRVESERQINDITEANIIAAQDSAPKITKEDLIATATEESVRAILLAEQSVNLSSTQQNFINVAEGEMRGADIIAAATDVFKGINITA